MQQKNHPFYKKLNQKSLQKFFKSSENTVLYIPIKAECNTKTKAEFLLKNIYQKLYSHQIMKTSFHVLKKFLWEIQVNSST